MKALTRITVIIFSLFLISCASMHKAITGEGVITNDVSEFDGDRVISVAPSMLDPLTSGYFALSATLGAEWHSQAPDTVYLVLLYESSTREASTYTSFYGVEIKVDGDIREFKTAGMTKHDNGSYNTVSRSIYTDSKNKVAIPFDYFERMLKDDSAMIRIQASSGYEDAKLSTRTKQGVEMAIVALENFKKEVDKYR